MTGRVAPGWYPDYEAPPGHQRYWDGARWTERRSDATATLPARVGPSAPRRFLPWVLGAVAVLVAISVVVLVVGQGGSGPSRATSPPPASTPGPPPSEQGSPTASPTATPTPEHRLWQVDVAIDGSTIRLTNGAEVRLLGIADSCGTDELSRIVAGQSVVLTRRGPDKDPSGHLLRYVDRDGLDVGKRLIQKGWANASSEPNPRRSVYQRVDGRSADRC